MLSVRSVVDERSDEDRLSSADVHDDVVGGGPHGGRGGATVRAAALAVHVCGCAASLLVAPIPDDANERIPPELPLQEAEGAVPATAHNEELRRV